MPPDYEKLRRAVRRRRCRWIGASASPKWNRITRNPRRGSRRMRCLKCHVSPIFDGDKCILCGGCADVCPENLPAPGGRAGDCAATRSCRPRLLARYGRVPERGEQGGDHQGRDPLHPLRPVRRALPDRRHHDGARGMGAGVT